MRLVDTRLEGRYRTRAFARDNANIGGGNINALPIAPFLCAVRCDSLRLPLASTTTHDHRMCKAPSARGQVGALRGVLRAPMWSLSHRRPMI